MTGPAYPANYSTAWVCGTVVDHGGYPISKTIKFTAVPSVMTDAALKMWLGKRVFTAVSDSGTGYFQIELPVTDDPDIVPVDFTYKVTDQFGRTFNVAVPEDTPVLNQPGHPLDGEKVIFITDVYPGIAEDGGSVQFIGGVTDHGDLTGLADDDHPQYAKLVSSEPLTINTTSSTGTPPLGPAGSTHTGLNIRSSFAGGEDEGQVGQYDSTGRLNLYSYQRADVGSYGENIRRFLMRSNAKSMDAWYAARENGQMTSGYDSVTKNPDIDAKWVPVAWTGAHWEANDGLSVHGHWSIEVPDSTGAVQTRFEVPFTNQEVPDGSKTLGVDVTNIRTNLCDFTVRATNGQVLRIGAGNSHNKDILLSVSSDRATSGRRWAIRADNTTEAGGNVGTEWQLLRYDDAGNFLGTALHVRRSDGRVAVGHTTPGAQMHIASASGSALRLDSTDPGLLGGILHVFTTDSTKRIMQGQVTGDSVARVSVESSGRIEWGTGTTGRDTNLYRRQANQLATDDSVFLGNQASPPSTPTGGGILYAENGALKWIGSSGNITTVAPA